jgi:hypothetical protein
VPLSGTNQAIPVDTTQDWGDGDSDLNEMDDSVSRCVNSAHVRDIDGLN